MRNVTRRELLGGATAALAARLAPLELLAAAVKPVTIRDMDIFPIEIPVSPAEHEAGSDHRFTVVRIETDAGVRGYSFAGPRRRPCPRSAGCCVGQDLFADRTPPAARADPVGRRRARGLGRHRQDRRPAGLQAPGRHGRPGQGVRHLRLEGEPRPVPRLVRDQAAMAGRLKQAGYRG